jgi:hypothetical protein
LAQAPLIAFQVSAEQWLNARQENSLNPHRKNKLVAIIISKTFTNQTPVTQTNNNPLRFLLYQRPKIKIIKPTFTKMFTIFAIRT